MSRDTAETAGSKRIAGAFDAARAAGRIALIPYVVAGYPDAETSFQAALTCIDAGADLLEIGLPYSDPLADGMTLQRASAAALAGGSTFDRSQSALTTTSSASTLMTRVMPRPPRVRPGPPPSGFNRYSE